MLENLLGSEDFHALMKKHTKEVIELLLKRGVNFSILTNIADVTFDPPFLRKFVKISNLLPCFF